MTKFNEGDKVLIISGGQWNSARRFVSDTVKKVHKTGNFILNNRPGEQWRQSGIQAGRLSYEHVELKTPELFAELKAERDDRETRVKPND